MSLLLTTAIKLASSPFKKSSITTLLPAEPKALSKKIDCNAASASILFSQIITP